MNTHQPSRSPLPPEFWRDLQRAVPLPELPEGMQTSPEPNQEDPASLSSPTPVESSSLSLEEKFLKQVGYQLVNHTLTEHFLKNTNPGCPYADLKKLSLSQINRVNDQFRTTVVVTEQEVQFFCYKEFKKAISSNILCSPKSSTCRKLDFYVLRTAQNSRKIGERDRNLLKECIKNPTIACRLENRLQNHWYCMVQQDKERKSYKRSSSKG